MKTILYRNVLIFVSILFIFFICISCQIYPPNEGKLVVSNNSTSSLDKIVTVYSRVYGSSEWINSWHSEEGNRKGKDATLFLPSGQYDIKIIVKTNYTYKSYETGYKHPIAIKTSDYLFLAFDGRGIYQL